MCNICAHIFTCTSSPAPGRRQVTIGSPKDDHKTTIKSPNPMKSLVKIPWIPMKFHEHFHEILLKSHQTTIFLWSPRPEIATARRALKSPGPSPWAKSRRSRRALAAEWGDGPSTAHFSMGIPSAVMAMAISELTGDFYGIKHIL